ncbi:dTDP-4-dehydrorhamnose 3,5-epimerase family protein [Nocardiopsis sp. NPDC006938]|uniref:dTDP-4-dehydrorhamnose 3,5-epimerase family protein n=1 Tax=Nocardiopsis sp. NPDC006938 TaxID=3364337 RepID=UPI00369B6167
MRSRPLSVHGAHLFTPTVFPDSRGLFTAPYQREHFEEATGRPLPPLTQLAYSRSSAGVVRGVHFTTAPPGMATYLHCPQGAVLDIAVDVRVGSPTYGRWEAVRLDEHNRSAVYLPVGMGHAFVSLTDDTVMSYLLSGGYEPDHEKAVNVLDPELDLPLPEGLEPVLSERDRAAPDLRRLREDGLLPDFEECLDVEARLRGAG